MVCLAPPCVLQLSLKSKIFGENIFTWKLSYVFLQNIYLRITLFEEEFGELFS
jgi:hypothetical protein